MNDNTGTEAIRSYPGLKTITHLKETQSWTSGLLALASWFSWQTAYLLGRSKTALIRDVVNHVLPKSPDEALELEKRRESLQKTFVRKVIYSHYQRGNAKEIYSHPVTDIYIRPEEVIRRLRYFSEDFLNREFDIFFSLLPDCLLNEFFSLHFKFNKIGTWNILSNGPDDFKRPKFMQPDTLAYNCEAQVLVACELKIDSALGDQQILNYCRMAASFEATRVTDSATSLKILVISPRQEKDPNRSVQLLAKARLLLASAQLTQEDCTLEETERRRLRSGEFLDSCELQFTTWQALGEFFEADIRERECPTRDQSYSKLVVGFLASLSEKYSRNEGRVLYEKAAKSL